MNTTESLNSASSRAVQVFSVAHKRVSHNHDHAHAHEHDHHSTSRLQPNTTPGWLYASGSCWTLSHTGGSRQDTHGTPLPEREGRGVAHTRRVSNRRPNDTDKRGTASWRVFIWGLENVQGSVHRQVGPAWGAGSQVF